MLGPTPNRYAGTDDGRGTGQTLDTERLTLMCGCGLVIRTPAVSARCRRRRVATWRSIRAPRLLNRIGPLVRVAMARSIARATAGGNGIRTVLVPLPQKRVLRAPPGREDIGAESVRGAGIWSGWFEKAQDQKPRFPAQLLVVVGIAFTHRFGWDRLDEFFDEESSIGGSRAQS